MNKPHKHAELIKAWADGALIQFLDGGEWFDCDLNKPLWHNDKEYRIKPEPRKYPQTSLTTDDMAEIARNTPGNWRDSYYAIANAALCHAIKAGQVVVPDREHPLLRSEIPSVKNAPDPNDPAEMAFWNFDAHKKGYADWKGRPQSERDAFKAEYRLAVADMVPAAMLWQVAQKVLDACLAPDYRPSSDEVGIAAIIASVREGK